MSATHEDRKREVEEKESHEPKKHKHSPVKEKRTPKKHTHKSIKDALSHEKVADVLGYMKTGKPIVMSSTESLLDALKILVSKKILSAPVYDEKTDDIAGFVDTVDIVSASVQILDESMKELRASKKKKTEPEVDEDDEYFIEDLMIRTVTIGSAIDLSGRDPYLHVDETSTVEKLIQILGIQNHHRIAVFEAPHDKKETEKKKSKLLGVVTQSGLAEYIFENFADLLQHYNKVHIKDMQHLVKKVETVPSTTSAFDAFKEIKSKRVSALPIVDAHGKIVDVLSASDLMFWSDWVVGTVLTFSNFESLTKDVVSFLNDSRTARGVEKKEPVTCKMNDKMVDVLDQMLFHNIHRIVVVDDIGHPVSVVNYADIFTNLL